MQSSCRCQIQQWLSPRQSGPSSAIVSMYRGVKKPQLLRFQHGPTGYFVVPSKNIYDTRGTTSYSTSAGGKRPLPGPGLLQVPSPQSSISSIGFHSHDSPILSHHSATVNSANLWRRHLGNSSGQRDDVYDNVRSNHGGKNYRRRRQYKFDKSGERSIECATANDPRQPEFSDGNLERLERNIRGPPRRNRQLEEGDDTSQGRSNSQRNSNPRSYRNQPKNFQNNSTKRTSPSNRNQFSLLFAKINECRSVEELVRIADENGLKEGVFPAKMTCQLWKRISDLQQTQRSRWNHAPAFSRSESFDDGSEDELHPQTRQLEKLLHHTINILDDCDPSSMSTLAQSMAFIVKHIDGNTRQIQTNPNDSRGYARNTNDGRDMDSLLRNLFLSDHRNQASQHRVHTSRYNDSVMELWEKIRTMTSQSADEMRPKPLVTITWSIATTYESLHRPYRKTNENHNKSDGISDYFSAVARSFRHYPDKFTSKQMSNLAWSAMTCGEPHPELMAGISKEFVNRRRRSDSKPVLDTDADTDGGEGRKDNIDAVTLCTLVTSFAKVGAKDEELYETVAEISVPMLRDFDARHLSNLAHAYGLAGFVPGLRDVGELEADTTTTNTRASGSPVTLFDALAMEAIPRLHEFNTQHLTSLIWAYATTEYFHRGLFEAVAVESTSRRMKEFSAQRLATLAWALSKCPPPSCKTVFDLISDEVAERGLDSFTEQGLSMMAHAFATVRYDPKSRYWDIVAKTTTDRLSELNVHACANIAWSFATINRPADDLFRGIETVAISKMRYFQPQGLSSLAWAYSTLGYDSPPLFKSIADATIPKLDKFKPQEKAMIALAYSRINQSFPYLFNEIASRSIQQIEKFGSLDTFNMIIAYAKAGHKSEKFMQALAEKVVNQPSNHFSPQMLVGIAWAYANTSHDVRPLYRAIAKSLGDDLQKLSANEIASIAWSFASVDCNHHGLFDALAEASDGKWSQFSAQSLANLAWAYSTMKEVNPRMYEEIAEASMECKQGFTSQGISNLLWAFANAGRVDAELFSSLAPVTSSLLEECNSQALANIAWAYAVSNVDDDSLFGGKSRFVAVCIEKADDFTDGGVSQLHQWNVWRKELTGAPSDLPIPLQERGLRTFMSKTFQKSALQEDVVSELSSLGFPLQQEVVTPNGYRLDIILEIDGKK
ncbi:hypothetical protein ACHAXS_007500, partial [Conticribra weissflogii]